MELMFILKLLTPHWLGLGLRSCETPADSLSVFSLPFSLLTFFPLLLSVTLLFSFISCRPSLISVGHYYCLIVHDVPQHVFVNEGDD